MEPNEPNLSDPADDPSFRPMKDAIRRVWGQEQAPAGLREKVHAALEAGRAPVRPPAPVRRRNPIYGLAASILLLLCIGGIVVRYVEYLRARSAPDAVPPALAAALIQAHDEALKNAEFHALAAPRDDYPAIARELRNRLARPVLAAPPAVTGWASRGARVDNVTFGAAPGNTVTAGHLLFVQGSNALSIFSLPASACPSCPATGCSGTSAGHPMAGFVQGGSFFCAVASSPDGSLKLEQVRSIRDLLRPQVTAAATAATTPSAAVVLASARIIP